MICSRFRPINGVALLIALALIVVSSHRASAQGDGPLGFRFGASSLVKGTWVSYWNVVTVPGARRDTVWERIAIVDADTVGQKPAHWIEVTMSGRKEIIIKALVLDLALTSGAADAGAVRAVTAARARGNNDVSDVVRLVIKRGKDEPIELKLPEAAPLLRTLVGGSGPHDLGDVFARDDSLDMGDEEVATSHGTRQGHRTSFVSVMTPPGDSSGAIYTYVTDVWTSPDIPITGIIRSSSRTLERPPDPGKEIERNDVVLSRYGVGARSLITGRVRIVTLPRAPLETGTR